MTLYQAYYNKVIHGMAEIEAGSIAEAKEIAIDLADLDSNIISWDNQKDYECNYPVLCEIEEVITREDEEV